MTLDPIQADVARIALAAAGHDFALAGVSATRDGPAYRRYRGVDGYLDPR